MEFHRHCHPVGELFRRAADDRGYDEDSFIELDDGRRVGNFENRGLWTPDDGPAVEVASTSTLLPSKVTALTTPADSGRIGDGLLAPGASAVEELFAGEASQYGAEKRDGTGAGVPEG